MNTAYTDVIVIRRKVFTEIARMAYADEDLSRLVERPYKLLPGETATYRENIFRERAVISERLRMALGLEPRTADQFGPITSGIENIDVDTRIYIPPLVQVIKIACESCPTRKFQVTNNCRKCLAHPCVNVCPKNAVSIRADRAHIDQEKCIKCGKCEQACPYNAIVETGRPCEEACGVDAIHSDYLNRAEIDDDKCVACGACINACPFGAISDKTEIYQLIKAINHGHRVCAILAPSFVGQFGSRTSPDQIVEAIKQLGIKAVVEVGMGADLTTMNEAKEYVEHVPGDMPYMGTSCCFSWKEMVRKNFPDQNDYISESSTPMIYAAQQIKSRHPGCKIVFIGPCISKKLEALQEHVHDSVDFVITYEELMGMFIAKDIEPDAIETDEVITDASVTGRGYAISGGVADAVVHRIQEIEPGMEVQTETAQGLHECVKLIRAAGKGQKDGMLLEGMACEGGCVGGPGCLIPIRRAQTSVNKFAKASPFESPEDNPKIPRADIPVHQPLAGSRAD